MLDQAATVIVAEPSWLKEFHNRERAGGTLIIESSDLPSDIDRKDIKVLRIPAMETSIKLSSSVQGPILVLLGALITYDSMISAEVVREEL